MNRTFAEHVTQTAFFLSISKKQIEHLAHVHKHPWSVEDNAKHEKSDYFSLRPGRNGNLHNPDTWVRSMHALSDKGLVDWVVHERRARRENPREFAEFGHYELTEAGRLTCLLLVEAGLIPRIDEAAQAA